MHTLYSVQVHFCTKANWDPFCGPLKQPHPSYRTNLQVHKVTAHSSVHAQSNCTNSAHGQSKRTHLRKVFHTHLCMHKVTAPSAHGQSNCTNSAHEHNKRTYLCKVISLICACTESPHPSAHTQSNCSNTAHEQSKCTHLRKVTVHRKVIALICACTKLMHTHLHICKVTAPIQCMSKVSAPIYAK